MATHDTHRRARRLLARLITGRFVWLLCGLITFILVLPDIPPTVVGRWIFLGLIAALLVAATVAARGGKRRMRVTLGLSAILFGSAITYAFRDERIFFYVAFACLLLLLIYTMFCILFYVLDNGNIGPDHIYGAICAYLMIAMIFATLFAFVEMHDHAAFNGITRGDPANRPWGQFFYFSTTTLSTVGYGDIVPVSPRARSICELEELTGTFYVAILIARLAGLYPPPDRGEGAE